MLAVPSPRFYHPFTYSRWINPEAAPGVYTAYKASNVEGNWYEHATSAQIAYDVDGFFVWVHTGGTAGDATNMLLDVGVDPAGGTSYTAVISNVCVGASGSLIYSGGHQFFFPLGIKAGSAVACRLQCSRASTGYAYVLTRFYGRAGNPQFLPVGAYSETVGAITGSLGVSFTPSTATTMSWTSLGTTTKDLWWWQIAYQINNSDMNEEYTYIDLAYGDGSNKHVITRRMHQGSTQERIGSPLNLHLLAHSAFCPVPAGSTMYVGGRCSDTPDSGYNAVAVGIGG